MTKNNNKRRNLYIIVGIAALLIFAILFFCIIAPPKTKKAAGFDPSSDFITFLDVGQGDCALIYSNGYCAVIDVGLSTSVDDISSCLDKYGIGQIDVALISHLHADHVGGLPDVAKNFEIDNLIMPEVLNKSTATSKTGKEIATKNGAAFYEVEQGINFNIGEFELTLLSDFDDSSNENNRSVFVMAKIGDIKFLFTGDAETKMESLLLKENLNLDCDVLKVGHHGSNTSSSKNFLKATTPEYAVISVGEDNIYHHPHDVTIDKLEETDTKILRTDKSGDITFNVVDGKLKIDKER